MAELNDIREGVREKYAAAARASAQPSAGAAQGGCCGAGDHICTLAGAAEVFGGGLYDLADRTVDVVISNCVINLSGDKPRVLREAARVLKPGGRLAVSDVIADPDMDDATRTDMAAWTGCVAGALTEEEFRLALSSAGFVAIEIRETHRVHAQAAAAIIRARKAAD